MVLVDTSVWIDHLRRGNAKLAALLEESGVLTHPFVIGELACGSPNGRSEFLSLLSELPSVVMAEDREVREFLEREQLFGKGLGWIDVHLLASASITGCGLWTLDRALGAAVRRLKI